MTIILEPTAFTGSSTQPLITAEGDDILHVGAHSLHFEGTDLFRMDVNGGVSAAEMAALVDGINRFAEDKEGVFGIINVIRLGSVSKEARMHLLRIAPLSGGIAYIGLKLQMRVAFTALNALRAKIHDGVESPFTFVTTEAEAREWVHRRRLNLDTDPTSHRRSSAPPSLRSSAPPPSRPSAPPSSRPSAPPSSSASGPPPSWPSEGTWWM